MSTYEKLLRLHRLLRRHRMASGAECGAHANRAYGQGRVIAALKMRKELTSKELAYVLGIRQQSLNELLNKLEKKEYIVRTPSDEDKRVMVVGLTDKGEALEQEDVGDELFQVLSKDEIKTFESYIDRIIASLEDRLGDEDDECMMHRGGRHMRSRKHGRGQMAGRGHGDGCCHEGGGHQALCVHGAHGLRRFNQEYGRSMKQCFREYSPSGKGRCGSHGPF